jgi:hypothetical protein
MGETCSTNWIHNMCTQNLTINPQEEMIHLEEIIMHVRITDTKEGLDWIQLSRARAQRLEFLNTLTNFRDA